MQIAAQYAHDKKNNLGRTEISLLDIAGEEGDKEEFDIRMPE